MEEARTEHRSGWMGRMNCDSRGIEREVFARGVVEHREPSGGPGSRGQDEGGISCCVRDG